MLMPADMSAENKPGNTQPESHEDPSRQAELEALRSHELEPIEYTKLNAIGYVREFERAEGSRNEENSVQWPLTIQLQTLTTREVVMKFPIGALVGFGKARLFPHLINGNGGWYENAPSSYGFETRTFRNKNAGEFDDPYTTVVRLGSNEQREAEMEEIGDFKRQIIARMKFAELYGHMFKRNIENISGLASLYLASVDVKPEDLEAIFTLPASPEDFGETLVSAGGVEYPKDVAMGRMIVSAMAIFNAVGLSEKPGLFNQFVNLPGWKQHVIAGGGDFQTWFGNPGEWIPNITDANEDLSKISEDKKRTKDTWKEETEKGVRGELTKWGNVFVRENDAEDGSEESLSRLFKKKVTEFLGNSKTAEEATELAWKYFKLFAAADFVAYEWYYDNGKNKEGKTIRQPAIHATIPLGGDTSSDFGKPMHPDAYLEFYHSLDRGGIPRGAYGKIKPLAVDVLRALTFGDKYKLPDGSLIDKPSLYDLFYIRGLTPDQIKFTRLPERAIISPYLRFFMANAGSEYGGGSFDMLSEKVTSPDPYLSPAFWEKLKSKVHVGITKEDVAWFNFIKDNGEKPYVVPSSDSKELNEYKLGIIRTMLDGIFAEEISRKWDEEPEIWGPGTNIGRWKGLPEAESRQYPISWRIIATANQTIPDLKYSLERLERIRKQLLVDRKQNVLVWNEK